MRRYGTAGRWVVLVHGGPGAPGEMEPVARALAGEFRVLEPFQRRGGAQPLTVARHVEDLRETIESGCGGEAPAVVGHSWGAMLALAFAAEHPGMARSLALVGCGTFDARSREAFHARLASRIDPALAARMAEVRASVSMDEDLKLSAIGTLLLPAYSHDLVAGAASGGATVDARGHDETWRDMLRLQEEGALPAKLAAIRSSVVMLHGDADPHPGRMTYDALRAVVADLTYVEIAQCGHYPWLERKARGAFFDELTRRLRAAGT